MSAFGLGVVQGFATSTDAALKTHIKDNKDRFDKNLEAALSRNLERSTRYDKDTREANEALKLMAGLVPNGDLGDAAAAIKGIGGVKQVQGFVDAYRTGLQTNPKLTFSAAIKFAGDNPELTSQQAVNQLVTPLEFTIPTVASKQKNWYQKLTADPRSMAVELPRILRERGITPTQADNLIKLQGAQVDWGQLRTPKQEVEREKQRLTIEGLKDINQARKIAIHTSIKDFGFKDQQEQDRMATVAAQLADTRLSTQVRQQALETAQKFDAPKAKAAIAASVAATIKSGSAADMVEQFNILGSSERYYQNQLRDKENQSNEWYETSRRLIDIRVERAKLLGKGLVTAGSDDFSKINVVSFANAIKADAIRDAGLKYELDRDGRFRMLRGGTADQIYQASRNAYNNFKSSFGKSSVPQVVQQREAMKQSMYNAQSTYVTNKVDKHFKDIGTDKTIHDKLPKAFKPGKMVGTQWQDGVLDRVGLQKLKPGTLVLINSRTALNANWDRYGEAGNFGVWTGKAIIQRKRVPGETARPTYKPNQTSFSR